jgi:hypothetical protein
MTEFEEGELIAATERYGVTQSIPDEWMPLMRKPYILRVVAHRYPRGSSLPPKDSAAFITLFAGTEDKRNTILGRLGIYGERSHLLEIVEQFIDLMTDQIDVADLESLDRNSPTYRKLISSGLLLQTLIETGAVVSLNPLFMFPSLVLAVRRHKRNPSRQQQLLDSIESWKRNLIMRIHEILREYPAEIYVDLFTELRVMVDKLRQKEIPEPPENVRTRQEIIAAIFNEMHEPIGIARTPEQMPQPLEIVMDDVDELLADLITIVGLEEEAKDAMKQDLSRLHPKERLSFLKEVIVEKALETVEIEGKTLEEVLERTSKRTQEIVEEGRSEIKTRSKKSESS